MPDAEALVLLLEADLVTPAQRQLDDRRRSGRGYQVRCGNCGEVYSWTPELALITAECTKCHQLYNCEFGSAE